MVVLAAGTFASLSTVGTTSSAIASATAGCVFGLGSQLVAPGAASAASIKAGTVGMSLAAGSLLGSAICGSLSDCIIGAAVGGASGVLSSSIPAFLSGLPGFIILGTAQNEKACITFDCWKPVLHDDSTEPSNGRLLQDVVLDPRIQQVTRVDMGVNSSYPEIILQNIWNERFRVEYVKLSSNQLFAHAARIE